MFSDNKRDTLTLFSYGSGPSVQFSSKSVVVTAADENDLEGTLQIDDIPTVHQMQLSMDNGGFVKRTLICDEMVAYEMQQRPSLSDGRQVFQICGRTIENKGIFPFEQFISCVHITATHMAQNVSIHGGDELEKYSNIGFWSPRIKLLYERGAAKYVDIARSQVEDDPSMLTDEIFVTAQVSVRPYSLSLTFCAFPFSGMGTCQVRVCKGLRPDSFLRDIHLSNDPLGLTKLITPPISDVILLHPTTQRLSEGLLSNFFATKFMPPLLKAKASHTDDNLLDNDANMRVARTKFKNYHLICASLETIHRGTMLDAIWLICKRDGIQVSFVGPNLADALDGKWSGAFIINNTYQLLPIDTMYLTDRHKTKVEIGTCPLVTHLKNEVFKLFHISEP
ncbi:hypothetical protein GGI25_001934 [Coemansia spiralis]|uniref:Uncharacterized protein n=1 Tax=Coemansia spiralis TaxID=417178 RepID=A0A9W8GA02_9FUNG|nr:hypothetical protein GGI26_002324 [Coemansia sp. RSA 1358]KAJ2678945.1 hypothetical protein GGI25_001934 [Coemansia spiralis]